MQYVFNPKNLQINPATASTFVDPALRDKTVSPELYALVCKGLVPIADVAALFAVNKSPEVLLKNHTIVKDSPLTTAPNNTKTLPEGPEAPHDDEGAGLGANRPVVTEAGAFDGRELCKKTQEELLILAASVGIDATADDFVPTRPNLIKAICEKAKAAEGNPGE